MENAASEQINRDGDDDVKSDASRVVAAGKVPTGRSVALPCRWRGSWPDTGSRAHVADSRWRACAAAWSCCGGGCVDRLIVGGGGVDWLWQQARFQRALRGWFTRHAWR